MLSWVEALFRIINLQNANRVEKMWKGEKKEKGKSHTVNAKIETSITLRPVCQ